MCILIESPVRHIFSSLLEGALVLDQFTLDAVFKRETVLKFCKLCH